MEGRLRQALQRAEEIADALSDPDVARDQVKFRALGREHTRLAPVVRAAERLRRRRQTGLTHFVRELTKAL
jgi:protein subunit release factor A